MNPHLNLAIAYANILAALYWAVMGQWHGVAISLLGAWLSCTAWRWGKSA